ncbi:hypothetical protein OH77DRAFT_1520368 [Trametes cingulata]|nr:hypothetical protein OH77DRAFT_1520368 [Trametes cingulata]
MASPDVAQQEIGSIRVLFDRTSLSHHGPADAPTAAATRATITTISATKDVREIVNLGRPLAVLPRTLDAQDIAPPLLQFLRDLTASSNAAAVSLACGSILAGQSSETDEYGDIAVWLGDGEFGPGHELEVLASLGLRHLLIAEGTVKELKISPHSGLPATVHIPGGASAEVARLRQLLDRLADPRIFRVRADVSLYLLLGRYEAGAVAGWAGLLGLGIES